MKLARQSPAAGIGLLQCLAYFSVMSIVLMFAVAGFHRFQMQSAHLTRNAEDISRALQAGELWRKEVRASSRAEIFDDGQFTIFRLAQPSHTAIFYYFGQGKIWRMGPGQTNWTRLLDAVRHSEMHVEDRGGAVVCRWELELATAQKTVRLKPLFTFTALPAP